MRLAGWTAPLRLATCFAMRTLLDLLLTPFRLLRAIVRFVVLSLKSPEPPAYVELHLEGTLRWRDLHRRKWAFGRKKSGPTVRGLEKLLHEIAEAPTTRGVVIRVEKLQATRARLLALRDALQTLRAHGKEVVLYWKHADNRHFALAPAATKILLAPGGPVHLIGYAAAITVLRDALDKVGLQPDFVRKGQFKTAPERFTHNTVSEEQRDLVTRILDRAYENLVHDVAARRAGDTAWARATIDDGPYTSRRALRAGLVDEMAYPDELPEKLGVPKARVGSPHAFRARDKWQMRWPQLGRKPRIAVVPLEGLIKPGKSFRWPGGQEMAGDESITRALDEVRKDDNVRAVIFAIDSRGGAASASELIWRAARRCAEAKPTVAWVEGVAASGGYFAAAGARHIVAAPGSLVGSIGVFSGRFDPRPLLDKLGIRQEVILRGAHAGLLEAAHSLTASDRAVLAAEVDNIYDEFVERVAEGRRRPPAEIYALAEGRVYLGADAPPAIVDQVGDFRTAVAWACREAGIDPEEADIAAHERTGVRPDLKELFQLSQQALAGMPLLLWADPIAPK